MPELEESIDVDVPVDFANQEWSEFEFRSFLSWYRIAPNEFSYDAAGDESEAQKGCVYLEPIDDKHTRVRIDLTYLPHHREERSELELEHADRHLAVQFMHYKKFVEAQYAKA